MILHVCRERVNRLDLDKLIENYVSGREDTLGKFGSFLRVAYEFCWIVTLVKPVVLKLFYALTPNEGIQFSVDPRNQWRAQKIFMGGFIQWHVVVICIWCVLFVTSQFDVICIFPNQCFGEVCWHNVYTSTSTLLTLFVMALNINHQCSKLGYQRNINLTSRHGCS